MARFHFRLATLLRLRVRAEQDAARAAARCESLLLEAQRERDALLAARHRLLLQRDELQRYRVEPARLRENHWQIVAVERVLPVADRRLSTRQRELQAARAALAERSRDRKLLEKLAERQLAEQLALEAGRERRELDNRPLPRHGMAIALRALSADGR
jgi:flagellar protein FliJ